ncbi:MAG: DUF3891 family protein [Bythopirellula sp.]|nr:DUF3891 family protein [Bythopirellula sp.]
MIRREVKFADGVPRWLLISQLEHARLSGELAERCISQFGEPKSSLDPVRRELLQAISHHDDGWWEWETKPRLDPELGRPLSFLELSLGEKLEIWERSIQAARAIGPLAAWIVAGHFSPLLVTVGHHAAEVQAKNWLREVAGQRSEWFAAWHSHNPALHTVELAGEALRWLQLFDILSLWPCSQYSVLGEQLPCWPEPYRTAEDWPLVREIRPASEISVGQPFRIVFAPWPFAERDILVKVAAHVVPVRHYANSRELLAARVPFVVEWVLVSSDSV